MLRYPVNLMIAEVVLAGLQTVAAIAIGIEFVRALCLRPLVITSASKMSEMAIRKFT